LTILISLWLNVTIFVLINLAYAINNVKSATIVIEQLGQIAILSGVSLGYLDSAVVIYDISLLINPVASAAYS
jgi:hypothetical protein